MTSVASLTPRVREALSVSSSYDDETIPALIRRCVLRLLRDYHFPKSQRRIDYIVEAGNQSFELPAGFKGDLGVQWHDPSTGTWSDPLKKSPGFRLPSRQTLATHYWLEGTKLWVDTPVSMPEMSAFVLQVFYESLLVQDTGELLGNENWFIADFEDVVFYYAVVKGAAEFRKPEVAQTFGPLWQDEQTSLAIYANELEWRNVEMRMHEPSNRHMERYPR